jgi:ubiquinone/menaquinone biosynthesis C-methylase UbiE
VTNPFLDTSTTRALYANGARLAARTGALGRAKTRGRNAADVIASFVSASLSHSSALVADIGCGRGTSTIALASRTGARVLGLDASSALLAQARTRFAVAEMAAPVAWVQADFHHLPLTGQSVDAAVAAFCLYHSDRPERVVAEIARVLRPGALAVLVTKSATSYRELDDLIERAGVDPEASRRPSLYASAHSNNLPEITAESLSVVLVEHERHAFTFADLEHAAEYLATNPKYFLPADLANQPQALARVLREAVPDEPVNTSSTVTYVLARRTEAR